MNAQKRKAPGPSFFSGQKFPKSMRREVSRKGRGESFQACLAQGQAELPGRMGKAC